MGALPGLGKKRRRSVIPDPVYIAERPAIVDERSCFGDWEVDTVMGRQGTGAIVSLAERKSRMYLVLKVEAKTATAVADALSSTGAYYYGSDLVLFCEPLRSLETWPEREL